jgi:hypothetical protein
MRKVPAAMVTANHSSSWSGTQLSTGELSHEGVCKRVDGRQYDGPALPDRTVPV